MNENIFEVSVINLDKMTFKFLPESEIQDLIVAQDLNISKDQVLRIMKSIASQYEEIKADVQKRLAKHLSNYVFPEFEVKFTLDRKADFRCPNGSEIIVDLGRLIRNPDDGENLKSGITHEVFHIYFKHLPHSSITESLYEIAEEEKARILLRCLDEGFAVNISGQNLEEFYNFKLKRNYDVKEAFESFNKFLSLLDGEEIKVAEKKGFESMGFFYIVGYEMLKAIIANSGEDSIKNILTKQDFLEIFDRYEEICAENDGLVKIDFDAIKRIVKRK